MDDAKKKLLRENGFEDEVARVELGLCPLCAEPIQHEQFRDDLSLREHELSGMCMACQTHFFTETPEDREPKNTPECSGGTCAT